MYVLYKFGALSNNSILEALKQKATSQVVKGVPKSEQRALPSPMQVSTTTVNDKDLIDSNISQDIFLLHPSDPRNFLKLCAMIWILLHH